MKILAIDLGEFNSVACIYDGEEITKNRFQKFKTAPAVLHDLLDVGCVIRTGLPCRFIR